MGIIKFFKKEGLVNRLVKNYTFMFNCGDRTAIQNLRKNYNYEELKEIYEALKENPDISLLQGKMLFNVIAHDPEL